MIKIVEYDNSYLNSLTDLYNLWDGMDDLTVHEMEQTVSSYTNNTDNKTFMAVDEQGRAVGYIFCGTCYYVGVVPFLEIIQIMIEPEYRGKGLGKMMMEYVSDRYYEQGIRQIRLHSRIVLKRAHEFYKKLGFKEFKESKFFVKDL